MKKNGVCFDSGGHLSAPSSVGVPKLITFLCLLHSPEGRFPAGAQRCGGGCRRAGGAGVRASARTPRAHRVLETQQRANQQQRRAHRCESSWVLLQPQFRSQVKSEPDGTQEEKVTLSWQNMVSSA